jgi:hypothetical protein
MRKFVRFGLALCATLAFADNYPRQPGRAAKCGQLTRALFPAAGERFQQVR